MNVNTEREGDIHREIYRDRDICIQRKRHTYIQKKDIQREREMQKETYIRRHAESERMEAKTIIQIIIV